LTCPAIARRCFLSINGIIASSASVRIAAGFASSIGGCAEEAPSPDSGPEGPAPLEPGGARLMDRFASR
jgi:hypothetical protein